MDRMARVLVVVVILALLVLPILPAWALTQYSAPLTVSSNSTSNYTMLAVQTTASNTWLATNGYMNSTANDTRVETLGGLIKPHMVADNKTLTAIPVASNSQTNLFFTTGNTPPTTMSIITGWGGYLTTADNATLEPSANFTIEQRGWLDTSYTAPSGVTTDISNSGTAWADTAGTPAANAFNNNGDADFWESDGSALPHQLGYDLGAGVYRIAYGYTLQAFSSLNTRMPRDWTFQGSGDNVTWTTLNTQAGITFAASEKKTFLLASITVYPYRYFRVNTTLNSVPDNFIRIAEMEVFSTNVQRPVLFSKADSIIFYVSSAGNLTGQVGAGTTVSAPVSSGVKSVGLSLAGGTLSLLADNVTQASVASGAVTDTGNEWLYLLNNVMPYMEYQTMQVGGNLRLWYQPVNMISGTTLPTRVGNSAQDAVITWGANPANVTVTMSSFTASGTATAGAVATTVPSDLLPENPVSDWYVEPAVSTTLLTNPLRPFVMLLVDYAGGITEPQAWSYSGLAFVLAVTVIVAVAVRNHLLLAGIAGCAAIVALVAQTIWPWWTLFFAATALVTGIIAERTQSV